MKEKRTAEEVESIVRHLDLDDDMRVTIEDLEKFQMQARKRDVHHVADSLLEGEKKEEVREKGRGSISFSYIMTTEYSTYIMLLLYNDILFRRPKRKSSQKRRSRPQQRRRLRLRRVNRRKS